MQKYFILLLSLVLTGSVYGQSFFKNEHPRLLFTKLEEQSVKELIKNDKSAQELSNFLIAKADSLLETPQLPYKIDKYGALLHTSRAYVFRLGTLALAYRMTGDSKYANKASESLVWVCNYPDWNPSHYLDTSEMSTAVAIAYDWLHDVLPDSTKSKVKDTLYERAITPVLNEYANGKPYGWARRENNWNIVCNTGMTLAALSIAEDYPNEANIIVDNATKYLPNCLKHFAPDGVCYEGPAYWGYTLSYLSLYLKAVFENGGDKGNIAQMQGIPETGRFYIETLTPSGKVFSFGNAKLTEPINLPSFFLLSKTYNQADVADWYREKIKHTIASGDELHQLFFLALPWYDPTPLNKNKEHAPLKVYHNSINDLIVLNGNREKKKSVYLIAKGGQPMQAHQQLDCGTFIIESEGVNWTEDLGADDYGLPGFWDYKPNGERWKYFRNNNLSHNTISIDHQIQSADGKAFICDEKPGLKQPYATLNLTSLYKEQANSVFRTYTLINDQTVEITDQIDLVNPQSTVSTFLATKAKVKIDKNRIVLTKENKKFYIDVVSPSNAQIITYPAQTTFAGEIPITDTNMIEIKSQFNNTDNKVKVRLSSSKR